jgi:hypothetical protein
MRFYLYYEEFRAAYSMKHIRLSFYRVLRACIYILGGSHFSAKSCLGVDQSKPSTFHIMERPATVKLPARILIHGTRHHPSRKWEAGLSSCRPKVNSLSAGWMMARLLWYYATITMLIHSDVQTKLSFVEFSFWQFSARLIVGSNFSLRSSGTWFTFAPR